MIQEESNIVDHKPISPRFFKLTLHSKHIAGHAQPGQFVDIRVINGTIPLLRKPFSLHRIDPAKQTIEILYEVVGEGTKLLSQKRSGETLNVLGPLGNGFRIETTKSAILVGGGMGVAPLMCLAETLGKKVSHMLIGARTKTSVICENEFKHAVAQTIVSTDDGTAGKKGLVSDLLLEVLEDSGAEIFACGPYAMLKAAAEIASKKKVNCQVSMEAFMACGIGACKGCAIKTKNGYKMACSDGPVFDAKEIAWN